MKGQLVSYIAPGAPATRRPANGREVFLRPEIGFTPKWYHQRLGIDFGRRWHGDVAYRRDSIWAMREELRKRFTGTGIGHVDEPMDLLTGTYGASLIAGLYGVPIVYAADNWPNCEHRYLTDQQVDQLQPPDLDCSPLFAELMDQVDKIAETEGQVYGFINWQGVLNNAQRLRGQQLFEDMFDDPARCHRLFDSVCDTMIEAARRLHQRQKKSGVEIGFFTVSNCLVNMISPKHYREFIFPYDLRLAETFGCLGVHNCAWVADPYIEDYASLPNLGYVDMGIGSDLGRAKKAFPYARRAVMYTPMDLADRTMDQIRTDLEHVALQYSPCDLVVADIESDTPDERVLAFWKLCKELTRRYG